MDTTADMAGALRLHQENIDEAGGRSDLSGRIRYDDIATRLDDQEQALRAVADWIDGYGGPMDEDDAEIRTVVGRALRENI